MNYIKCYLSNYFLEHRKSDPEYFKTYDIFHLIFFIIKKSQIRKYFTICVKQVLDDLESRVHTQKRKYFTICVRQVLDDLESRA